MLRYLIVHRLTQHHDEYTSRPTALHIHMYIHIHIHIHSRTQLEDALQGSGVGRGALQQDARSRPHGQAAVADLLQGQVPGGGVALAELEWVEAEVPRSALARLAALGGGHAGDH